jgi:hypothetical protein
MAWFCANLQTGDGESDDDELFFEQQHQLAQTGAYPHAWQIF